MNAPATSPPRLLAINNYFYRRGGAEAVFFDHMDLFERVGWDVVPFAMQHAENQASPWSPFFVSELEYGRTSGILAKANQATKVIFSFEARRKIGELIRRAPPSVAHAHNVYHHLSPSIFGALKAANVPVVMTVHDLKLACPAYKMLTHGRVCEACHGGRIHNVVRNRCVKDSALLSGLVFLETLVHRTLGLYRDTLAKLITPSRFYRDKLVAWGWNPAQIAHVPNCIDTSRFVPAASIGNYFVYAGRLAPEKGLATLVRAAAMSNQRVVLAGSGPEEQALRRLAVELEAEIVFAGRLDGADLHKTIAEAKALILPSEWYENAPISVLEAYALGRPVIGTDIGGIPEMIRPGETGALAPSGNATALAEAMAAMAAVPERLRSGFGAAGRAWVETAFSPAAYRDGMLDLYRAVGAPL